MNVWVKRGLAVAVTVGLSEFIPEVVNGVLILLIVGVLLGHYSSFTFASDWLSSILGSPTKK
jgi:hypothetical protein